MNNTIRLDKYLSSNGFVSRRGVEKFLQENTVLINGSKAKEPGERLDPEKDHILINGKKIIKPNYVYIALNKPIGVVSTAADERGRPTVISLVKTKERVYPVGRLDQDSRGLMLLTNDGDLTYHLTHPKFHIDKTYIVTVQGNVALDKLTRLRKGIRLEEGVTSPADIAIIKQSETETVLRFVIHEGWKRQIRRMLEAVKLKVIDLQRVSIGPLQLGNLGEGKHRNLTPKEVEELKATLLK
jgi:23S rRNA pseudouridine2605 synthase